MNRASYLHPAAGLLFIASISSNTTTATTLGLDMAAWHDEVIKMSPFESRVSEERSYCACAGRRRFPTPRGSVVVLSRALLDDHSPQQPENISPFSYLPLGTHSPRENNGDIALFEGLPIATIVDPATVDHLVIGRFGAESSGIRLRSPADHNLTDLKLAVTDHGTISSTVRSSRNLPLAGGTVIDAQLSLSGFENAQHGQSLGAEIAINENRTVTLSHQYQGRRIQHYGKMRFNHTTVRYDAGEFFFAEVGQVYHRLDRDDARQFLGSSPEARIPGLGFLNLDLLTAPTHLLADNITRVLVGGENQTLGAYHFWTVETRWHHRRSDWETSANPVEVPARRKEHTTTLRYTGAYANERLHLGLHGRRTSLSSPESSMPGSLGNCSLNATWQINEAYSIFAETRQTEQLPWTTATPDAFSVDRQTSDQVGIGYRSWGEEVIGMLAVRRTRLAPVGSHSQSSLMGSVTVNPHDRLTLTANAYLEIDSPENTPWPYRRASLAARYTVRRDDLTRVTFGGALNWRDRIPAGEESVLPGGLRWDLQIGYRFWLRNDQPGEFQLALTNVLDQPWPVTRFAPDPGREWRLTYSQRF